jgi:hypothetical protein
LEKIFRLNENTFRLEKITKLAETVEKWLSDDLYSARSFESKYGYKAETSIFDALRKQIAWYQNKNREAGQLK